MRLWTDIAGIVVAIGKPVYWIVFRLPLLISDKVTKWQSNRVKNTKTVKNIKIVYSERKKSRLKEVLKKLYWVKTIQFSIKIPTPKLPKFPKLPKLNLALAVFGILILGFGIYIYVFRGLPSP